MASVSVIIPVYNGKKHLKQCLNSVLRQTLKDTEIICIDDGSTDASYKLLERYAKYNANITIAKTEHKGAGNARNKAIEMSKGKYVCFMDCDDWYYKDNALELLYSKAEENDANICGGSFCEYYPKEKTYKTDFKEDLFGYTFTEEGKVNYTDYQFDFGYHRFLYNREFLQKEGITFPNYARYQDVVFFVRAMCAAKWFYSVKDIIYCYRMRKKIYGNMTPKLWNDQTDAMCEVLKFARDNGLGKLFMLTCGRIEGAADIMAEAIVNTANRGVTKEQCKPENLLNLRRMALSLKTDLSPDMSEPTADKYGFALDEVAATADKKEVYIGQSYYELYNDIKNSLSFKIGRALTALPRILKKLFRR